MKTISEPKVEHHECTGVRRCAFFHELLSILNEAWDAAEEGQSMQETSRHIEKLRWAVGAV